MSSVRTDATDGGGRGGPRLSAEQIETWLVEKLAEELRVDAEQISIREPLANYSLDSTTAVSISGELEELLGLELPTTLLWDFPTIEGVANHLESLSAAS